MDQRVNERHRPVLNRTKQPPPLSIGLATEDDFDSIMKISGDIDDYQPHALKKWLRDGMAARRTRYNLGERRQSHFTCESGMAVSH